MKITQNPSPNIDERTSPISMLVLHYTGMESGAAALERLCDPAAKVSAHYLVFEDGVTVQMVDEEKRAWHAGLSFWNGVTDINSASIGIEIVNGGHDYDLPDFPRAQIKAVTALSKDILSRRHIPAFNIVGHSDIAPARKQDPGEKFPWAELAASGIGYWPDGISNDNRVLFERGAKDRGIAILQRGLAFIGYDARVTSELDEDTALILTALQRRYLPAQVSGQIDVQTIEVITKLADAKKALKL